MGARVTPAMVAAVTRSARVQGARGLWLATERVLYLAAIDTGMELRPDASREMTAAFRALRTTLRADREALYETQRVPGGAAMQWTEGVRALCRAEVDALAPRLELERGAIDARDLRAALLVWAAAEVWGEGAGRWSTLAGHAAALAAALDGAVDRGAAGLLTGAAATRVRARAAGLWTREGR